MLAWNTISTLSILLPLTTGIYLYRRLDRPMKILTIFLVIVVLVELMTFFTVVYNFTQDWTYHIYTLLEYCLLILIFSHWEENKKIRKTFRFSIIAFAVVWLGFKFTIEEFTGLDNYTASLESVLLIGIAIYTLFSLNKNIDTALSRDPRFWVSAAILIYFSGNLMIFAFSNVLVDLYAKNLIPPIPIHSTLNITKNLLFAGGFLCLLPHLNFGGLLSSEP